MLALTSVAAGEIQITQPAPKADTLAIEPDPVIHWVYGSNDPGLVSIIVRQVDTDHKYEPMLALYRGATAVSQASVPIPLSTIKFEEGMNITISIAEVTDENQDDPLDQKVLASRGPLRLVAGNDGIVAMGTMNQNSTAAVNPNSPTSAPASLNQTTSSSAVASFTSDDTSEAAKSDSITSASASDSSTTANPSAMSTTDHTAAAVSPTSSNGDRLDLMTNLYITFLVVTAIPAFLFGFNP
jgi:hypothetical protein